MINASNPLIYPHDIGPVKSAGPYSCIRMYRMRPVCWRWWFRTWLENGDGWKNRGMWWSQHQLNTGFVLIFSVIHARQFTFGMERWYVWLNKQLSFFINLFLRSFIGKSISYRVTSLLLSSLTVTGVNACMSWCSSYLKLWSSMMASCGWTQSLYDQHSIQRIIVRQNSQLCLPLDHNDSAIWRGQGCTTWRSNAS